LIEQAAREPDRRGGTAQPAAGGERRVGEVGHRLLPDAGRDVVALPGGVRDLGCEAGDQADAVRVALHPAGKLAQRSEAALGGSSQRPRASGAAVALPQRRVETSASDREPAARIAEEVPVPVHEPGASVRPAREGDRARPCDQAHAGVAAECAEVGGEDVAGEGDRRTRVVLGEGRRERLGGHRRLRQAGRAHHDRVHPGGGVLQRRDHVADRCRDAGGAIRVGEAGTAGSLRGGDAVLTIEDGDPAGRAAHVGGQHPRRHELLSTSGTSGSSSARSRYRSPR
jgi:hypothetical protein